MRMIQQLLESLLPDLPVEQVLELVGLRGKPSAEPSSKDFPMDALEDLVDKGDVKDVRAPCSACVCIGCDLQWWCGCEC